MTALEIVSTIRNHVVDGLKGVNMEAFSKEQLLHEVMIAASSLIEQAIQQGTLKRENVSQRIDGLELICKDISNSCEVSSHVTAKHIEIPKLLQTMSSSEAIIYLGPMDNSFSIKVYDDMNYRYNKYSFTNNSKPYAWVSKASSAVDGHYDVYIFNLGDYGGLKFVSIEAVFENPYDLLNTEYSNQFVSQEFYAPTMIQQQIIDTLTQKYVSYYRQLNMPYQNNSGERF